MDFIKLAKERYSVRKFAAKKVEEEKVAQILEAGRCAPTAVNYQPQRILVIESGDSLAKLRNCTPYHSTRLSRCSSAMTRRRAGNAPTTAATWAWSTPRSSPRR